MANKYSQIADKDAKSVDDEKLKISFEYLDFGTDGFFFHGLEASYYEKFFDCITRIKQSREREILEQTHQSLIPKPIFKQTGSQDAFPSCVVEKMSTKLFLQTRDKEAANAEAISITSRAFEVRVAKSYGRIHGFVWNNVFHIVWIDPAHNLYPKKENGVRRQGDYATVKCFSGEELVRLRDELKALQDSYDELYATWAEG